MGFDRDLLPVKKELPRNPAVACLILFGDNYTPFEVMDRWNSRSLFGDMGDVSREQDTATPEAVPNEGAPLAERMRPRSLAEFVGQNHLVGEGRILRRLLAGGGTLPSLVLWGAPGTGKTTPARLLAENS